MALPFATYLFDLDGTLIDTVPLIVESYRHATAKVLGVAHEDETYRELIGLKLPVACAKLSSDPELAEQVLQAYLEHNMAHHDRRVRAFAGVVALLTELQARGAKLAVVTSKRRAHALLGLELCGLTPFFPVLVAGDDVQSGKPDPECVLKALSELGVEAFGALMVGDSVHDVEAGMRAGTSAAFVTWGAGTLQSLGDVQPAFICEEVGELLSAIKAP